MHETGKRQTYHRVRMSNHTTLTALGLSCRRGEQLHHQQPLIEGCERGSLRVSHEQRSFTNFAVAEADDDPRQ